MKKIGSIMLLAALLLSLVPQVFAYKSDNDVNIALGKPAHAVASADPSVTPDKAVDGSTDTYWAQGNNTPYIMIDLLEPTRLSGITLRQVTFQQTQFEKWMVYGTNTADTENYTQIGTLLASSGDRTFAFGEAWEAEITDTGSYQYIWITNSATVYKVLSEIEIYPYISNSGIEEYKDIEGESYETAVKLLTRLGVIPAADIGIFGPDIPVTRGDALQYVNRLFRVPDVGDSKQIFADIEPGSRYYEDVAKGVAYGNISPNAARFRPDDYITAQEFLKMLLWGLGYSDMCEARGGYPAVTTIARQVGFSSALINNATLTKQEAAQLIYQAMDITIYHALKTPIYMDHLAGQTLLESYHLEHRTGTVTSNSKSALPGYQAGGVSIDGKQYIDVNGEGEKYLGYLVDYFVDEETDELFVVNPQKNVTVLDINANDLDEEATDTSSRTIAYFVGNRTVKETYSSDANVFINGYIDYQYTNEDLLPQQGKIRMVDNNRDGTYDVVLIESCVSVIVDAVGYSGEKMYLYGRDGSEYIFDDYEENVQVKTAAGANVTALEQNDVVDIYMNRGEDRADITVLNDSFQGSIEEIEKGGSKVVVTVSGQNYEVIPSCVMAAENGLSDSAVLEAGTNGVFYLNSFGKIVWIGKRTPDTWQTAFVQKVDKGRGVDERVRLRVFGLDGQFQELYLADPVVIDNTEISNSAAAADNLIENVIMYRVNTSGEIKEIDTASEGGVLESGGVAITGLYAAGSGAVYGDSHRQECLLPKTGVPSFVIPQNFSFEYVLNGADQHYGVLNAVSFANQESCAFIPYNMDEFKRPEFILQTKIIADSSLIGAIQSETDPAMVISSVTTVAQNDEIYTKITGYNWSGTEINLMVGQDTEIIESGKIFRNSEAAATMMDSNKRVIVSAVTPEYLVGASDLRIGDILRYSGTDSNVTGLERLYSVEERPYQGIPVEIGSDPADIYFSNGALWYRYDATFRAQYGVLYEVSGSNFKMGSKIQSYDSSIAQYTESYNTSGITTIVYDEKKNRVYQGDSSDLLPNLYDNSPNSRVMLITDYNTPRMLVIFKFDNI